MDAPRRSRDELFGNVLAHGFAGVARLRVNGLISDLPFAREKPVERNLGGVGMGSAAEERRRALSRTDERSFSKTVGVEHFNGQALPFRGFVYSRDKKGNGKFSSGEPVDHLPLIARKGKLHFAKKAPDEIGTELRAVVKKAQAVRHGAHRLGIIGNDLTLPLWSEKISIRFELLGIDEVCIVGVFAAVHVALKNKDIVSLGIGIMVLAFPPFRFIHNFRDEKRRLYRVQYPRVIEDFVRRDDTAEIQIPQIFSRPSLRHDPNGELRRAATALILNRDLGKLFLKVPEDVAVVAAAVNRHLAFSICGLDNLIP